MLRDIKPMVKKNNSEYISSIFDWFRVNRVKLGHVYSFLSHLAQAEALVELCHEHKKYIARTIFKINDEKRQVLFQHPNSPIHFKHITIPAHASLEFGIGISEKAWVKDSDAIHFEILIECQNGDRHALFSKRIDPKKNSDDRRWFDFRIDLSAYSLKIVTFIFKTSRIHPRPAYNEQYDWAAWSNPRITADDHIIFSFLDNLETAKVSDQMASHIKEVPFVINDDLRAVLFQPPNSEVTFKDVTIYKNAMLQFGIGMKPNAWDKEGGSVIFEIEAHNKKRGSRTIFRKESDPKKNLSDRRWFDEELNLSEFEGIPTDFKFRTTCRAPEDRIAAWVGWSWPKIVSDGKPTKLKKSDHTNILLITVDTLRADYLHCYGKKDIQTPILDMLAGQGVRFTDVYSQSHITSPSHLSILTSKYPIHHARNNNPYTVPLAFKTIARHLSEKSFSTFAIVSVELLNPYWSVNIDNGFDQYYSIRGNNRIGDQVKDIFRDWIEKNYTKRFFGWVHLFDPHVPYIPPKPFFKKYYTSTNKTSPEMSQVEFPKAFKEHMAWLDSVSDLSFPISQYAAEISYVDSVLGDITTDLDKFGMLENTFIIITADHGESLTEHGIYFDHQSLYDPVIRIPLIMKFPQKLPQGKVVNGLGMGVDILPTIFDVLGYELPSQIDGKSLLPMIRNNVPDIHDAVYSEHVDGTQLMIRTKKWKYIKSLQDRIYTTRFSVKKGCLELYDLENDPGELKNVIAVYPDIAQTLDLQLSQWLEKHSNGNISKKQIDDEEVKKRLQELGYF